MCIHIHRTPQNSDSIHNCSELSQEDYTWRLMYTPYVRMFWRNSGWPHTYSGGQVGLVLPDQTTHDLGVIYKEFFKLNGA